MAGKTRIPVVLEDPLRMDSAALQDLERCKSLLKSIDQQLQPFQHWKTLEQKLEPLQQARMHLAVAASASAVYQTLLHLRGSSAEDQAHAKELARLEIYKTKVTRMETEKWLQEHRPNLSVDIAGANRFISAAIPELSSQQKHALRMAGRKHSGHAIEDHNASSSAAATQFLASLANPSGAGAVPLQTGGIQRAATGGTAPIEHLRTRAPLSKKEKRRSAKEAQGRAGDKGPFKRRKGR